MELNLLLYRSELKKKTVYNYIFYGIIVGLVEDKTINRDELLKLYVDTFGVPKDFENIVAIARENEIKNLIFFEIKNKGTSNLKILIDEKIKEMKLDEKNNKNTFDGWLK